VGRKTCNVVLSNIYNVPTIAVDTHVARVSRRLQLTKSNDVLEIEKDLMNFFPKDKWSKVHHQLVLFGRYTCKSIKPLCDKCPFQCKYKRLR
jgi:endonuclease-3